jgi:two-component system CheB/CheR fusion protein
MPRNAINTQLVDWILPVKKMPEKLIDFRASSERLHLTTDDDGKIAREINADASLREILTLLRVRTGHDFTNYKKPTLVRRIARHLQIHSLENIPAYLKFLRDKPEEIHSLLKNLLINVTNFFRDKEAWDVLERDVIPNLFAGKNAGDMVRVWSAIGRYTGLHKRRYVRSKKLKPYVSLGNKRSSRQ